MTNADSERRDKQQWHRRWRLHERMALRKLSPQALDTHLSTDAKAASNLWSMAKDGRQYWPVTKQMQWAYSQQHQSLSCDPEQRIAQCLKFTRRIMAK